MSDQLQLLHNQFAHPSLAKMKQLNTYHKWGYDIKQLEAAHVFCRACLDGKAKLTTIRKVWKGDGEFVPARAPFDRLHCDLIGPYTATNAKQMTVKIRSFSQALYSLTIVDEYSRYRWTFPLKHKSDAFNAIRDLVVEIQCQYNTTPKELHSDGGGEFVNNDMVDMCKEQGIKHTYTTLAHPQHNGICERSNGLALSSSRTMLAHAGAPVQFVFEAMEHADLVFNRTPRLSPISDGAQGDEKRFLITPFEVLEGSVPSVDKIKVWGCDATIEVNTLLVRITTSLLLFI